MIVYADEPGRLPWKEFDSFVSRSHYNVITALKKADRLNASMSTRVVEDGSGLLQIFCCFSAGTVEKMLCAVHVFSLKA